MYTTYIKTTPEKLWNAITNPEFMKQYWHGIHFKSDWKVGSSWEMRFSDGQVADTGKVLEIEPPKRLVLTWRNEFKPEMKAEGYSLCTFDIEPTDGAVRLTITHSIDRSPSEFITAVSGGWPRLLSNLKSFLETGNAIWSNTLTIEECRAKAKD